MSNLTEFKGVEEFFSKLLLTSSPQRIFFLFHFVEVLQKMNTFLGSLDLSGSVSSWSAFDASVNSLCISSKVQDDNNAQSRSGVYYNSSQML